MQGNEDSPQLMSSSAEELAKARRASAQKYADRCIRLGMIFHAAQQESYEEWEALDEWIDGHREDSV